MYVHVRVRRCDILHRMVSGGDLKEMRSKPSRDLGTSIPGRGNSECKSPEAGIRLVFSRNNKSPHGSQ